jgi:hypothetical protein
VTVRREDFEHVIGAAANVAGEDEFVVIGSQAVLGPHPDAPDELLQSMEVDLCWRSVSLVASATGISRV